MTTPSPLGRSAPAWSRWTASGAYSVGFEEELMVIDRERECSLATQLSELLPRLSDGLRDQLSEETQDGVLELATHPHRAIPAAAAEGARLRATLRGELEARGLAAASAGTHPGAVWDDVRIASGDRHQEVYGTMRELARREPTFGLHVHVGVADPERAIVLFNRLRAHLALLLALSANSPFWQGRDTGLASARTSIFQAFPRVGTPRGFADYTHYVESVDLLIRCGAMPDPTYMWWDVRPQPRFGTVEIRIMDAQSESWATAALAALAQATARLELEEGYHADPRHGNAEVLAENRFLAARDGPKAALIDPVSERRVPVVTALAELIEAARPHAQDLGCEPELDAARELAREGGAARQRARHAGGGTLADVVAWLADAF